MKNIRNKLYEIIFEADTPAGNFFDVVLLFVILMSVALVMLESVPGIRQNYLPLLKMLEWIITGIFTLEYTLRMLIVKKPFRYIFSFYGIIDFLAVIPTYLSFFVLGYQSLIVIRALRLLRVFRILKITRYSHAGRYILLASMLMILGYAIISVPTGIVTAKIIHPTTTGNTQVCANCLHDKHDDDADFCKKCGSGLNFDANKK